MATVSGSLDSNSFARRHAHRLRRWHHGFSGMLSLALSVFTWVMWLRDRSISEKRFADEIFALNIMWWITFSNDAAAALGDFIVGLMEAVLRVPPLYTGANSHSTTLFANCARIGVSMTMAVGLFTRWEHYFDAHPSARTSAMFQDALNGSEALLLLGSMTAIMHLGSILYHFIAASAEIKNKKA